MQIQSLLVDIDRSWWLLRVLNVICTVFDTNCAHGGLFLYISIQYIKHFLCLHSTVTSTYMCVIFLVDAFIIDCLMILQASYWNNDFFGMVRWNSRSWIVIPIDFTKHDCPHKCICCITKQSLVHWYILKAKAQGLGMHVCIWNVFAYECTKAWKIKAMAWQNNDLPRL